MGYKVLLINTEHPEFVANKEYYVPLSVLHLGTYLKQRGIEVSVLDLNVSKYRNGRNPEEEVICRVQDFKPDLVGFGCLFAGHFPHVMRYSTAIKNVMPSVKIVTGGMHPTIFHSQIIENFPDIDFVISGEGEIPLATLVECLKEDYPLLFVPMLTYRHDGKVCENFRRGIIQDLNTLPMPDYSLINIEDYYYESTLKWHNPRNLPIRASIPIVTSRGCPMDCNFCSMFMVMGKKWRHRSYMKVVDELEMLYTQYGHSHFSFMDDNLTLNKKNTLGLCNEILKRNMRIQFETPNGISTKFLDEETLDALCQAGLVRVSLAIESGSEYIRNQIMKKMLSTEHIYEVVKLTKKYPDLFVRAFFIMGMPEDTNETLQETYDMMLKLDVDKPTVNTVVPYPGTQLFDQCVRDNLFTENIDLPNLWKMDKFHFTGNQQFFVKPYRMSLDELQVFRDKFDFLLVEKGFIR
jgi:anaerobic magnesium-protoporphyrin IX monomethyl ester cyclase